jgi:hypothetical protein
MTRAEKFIEKSNTPLWQFSDVSGRFVQDKDLAELLEKFHSQCLPTDEEILRNFRNITESNKGADKAIKRRQGAVWCKNFVREEPKKEKLICCGCGQDISGNAIFENHLSFHNESCIERMKHQSEFMFRKPKAVDNKVSPTKKKEVKSCKTCAFHDVFYLDFPCIGCWDQIARIYLLWKPKSPKEPPVKENLPDEKRTCINCKYEKRPIEEACVGCGDWTNWQPKEPTLEDEINAFDTEKYWLDELLKTTERQSEILKKLIEVKSKKK